jgi:hypothetical protein
LNHWLIAQTGEEITAREVFSRFKRYADFEAGVPMLELVNQLHRAAGLYRKLVEAATKKGPLDRTELFAYRTSALESEVVKPLLLWLYDDDLAPLVQSDIDRSLNVVESWLVPGCSFAPERSRTRRFLPNYSPSCAKAPGSTLAAESKHTCEPKHPKAATGQTMTMSGRNSQPFQSTGDSPEHDCE